MAHLFTAANKLTQARNNATTTLSSTIGTTIPSDAVPLLVQFPLRDQTKFLVHDYIGRTSSPTTTSAHGYISIDDQVMWFDQITTVGGDRRFRVTKRAINTARVAHTSGRPIQMRSLVQHMLQLQGMLSSISRAFGSSGQYGQVDLSQGYGYEFTGGKYDVGKTMWDSMTANISLASTLWRDHGTYLNPAVGKSVSRYSLSRRDRISGASLWVNGVQKDTVWDSLSASSHSPVTVANTSSIDMTLVGQGLSATVSASGVNHDSLGGLKSGGRQYNHLSDSQTAALHSAVTLDRSATGLLSLNIQSVSVKTQNANVIFAGPTTGGRAVPTFRSLVTEDIPSGLFQPLISLTANYIPKARSATGLTNSQIFDNGTYIGIGTDVLITGALSAQGGAVFNDDSADVDFRVEGNGDANLLFCNAGNDKVGIGVDPVIGKLQVAGSIVISDTQNASLLIGRYSAADSNSYIDAGDSDHNYAVGLTFRHRDGSGNLASAIKILAPNGYIGILTAVPGCALCVNGGVSIGDDAATTDNNLHVVGAIDAASATISTKLEIAGALCLRGRQEVDLDGLGDELVVDGGFASGTNWTPDEYVTITGGEAVFGTNGSGLLTQTVGCAVEVGETYRLSVNFKTKSGDNSGIQVYDGSTTIYNKSDVSATGVYTTDIVATTTLMKISVLYGVATVDDISLRKVGGAASITPTHSVINITNVSSSAADIIATLAGGSLAVGSIVKIYYVYDADYVGYYLTVIGLGTLQISGICTGAFISAMRTADGWSIETGVPPAA